MRAKFAKILLLVVVIEDGRETSESTLICENQMHQPASETRVTSMATMDSTARPLLLLPPKRAAAKPLCQQWGIRYSKGKSLISFLSPKGNPSFQRGILHSKGKLLIPKSNSLFQRGIHYSKGTLLTRLTCYYSMSYYTILYYTILYFLSYYIILLCYTTL